MNINTFYAKPTPNRLRQNRTAGIIIDPLPDAYSSLVDKIANTLKAVDIECTHFIITDAMTVPEWCEAVGIERINGVGGLLGLWIHDRSPEDCIEVVREVVGEHLSCK